MVDINPTTLLIISNSTGPPSVTPMLLWPSCCAKDVCFFMKAFVFAYTFALSRFVCLLVFPSFQYSLQDSGCVCVMRRFSIFLTWVLRLHFPLELRFSAMESFNLDLSFWCWRNSHVVFFDSFLLPFLPQLPALFQVILKARKRLNLYSRHSSLKPDNGGIVCGYWT